MKDRVANVVAWWMELAPREQALVGGAGASIALALLWFVLIQPARNLVLNAETRVAVAEQEVELSAQLRRELVSVGTQLRAVEERVRSGPRGNLFTTLESLAAQSALKVASVEPQAAPTHDLYEESKVQVVLKEVTLAQTVNFLHRIESADQLLSIKSLRLRTRTDQSDLLDVTFSVSSFETR